MNADLGLSAAQFGFASGIFFLGYIVLEVPSNLALHKFGARRWLARIMISWGIVAVLFTFVQNFTQLTTLRFLLGVAEAGFFPGAILFLSLFVPARYRSGILGLFYLAQPLTTVIGAPGRLADQPERGLRPRGLAVHVPRRRPAGHHRRRHRVVLPLRQPGEDQVAQRRREGVADR